MRRNGDTVVYTSDELREMRALGETLTNWAKVDALTDEEVEASIDFEDEGISDWDAGIPVSLDLPGKQQLTIRLDKDIVAWFKSHGGKYQTKINAVLRAYMDAHGDDQAKPSRRKAS